MHELATEIIRKNNEEIIDSWDYEVRKKLNTDGCEVPKGCELYSINKKCHDMEQLNCYFCFCPKYDRTVKEGKCKIDSPAAKYTETTNGDKILDCSDCTLPHKKENAIKLLDNLFTNNDIIIS